MRKNKRESEVSVESMKSLSPTEMVIAQTLNECILLNWHCPTKSSAMTGMSYICTHQYSSH